MTTRPNLDAVTAWILAGDPAAPICWPIADPLEGMSRSQRLEYVIAHAASGAPAFTSLTAAVEHVPSGRMLPPPLPPPTPRMEPR